MAWWSFLFLGAGKRASARLAKERLQAVVLQQRATRPPRVPDYLPVLQREQHVDGGKHGLSVRDHDDNAATGPNTLNSLL